MDKVYNYTENDLKFLNKARKESLYVYKKLKRAIDFRFEVLENPGKEWRIIDVAEALGTSYNTASETLECFINVSLKTGYFAIKETKKGKATAYIIRGRTREEIERYQYVIKNCPKFDDPTPEEQEVIEQIAEEHEQRAKLLKTDSHCNNNDSIYIYNNNNIYHCSNGAVDSSKVCESFETKCAAKEILDLYNDRVEGKIKLNSNIKQWILGAFKYLKGILDFRRYFDWIIRQGNKIINKLGFLIHILKYQNLIKYKSIAELDKMKKTENKIEEIKPVRNFLKRATARRAETTNERQVIVLYDANGKITKTIETKNRANENNDLFVKALNNFLKKPYGVRI